MELRMGVLRSQKEALTSPMVRALYIITEEELGSSTSNDDEQEDHQELMAFIHIGFGAGLRGEEIPPVSLQGILHFYSISETKQEWTRTRLSWRPSTDVSKEKQVSGGIFCQSPIILRAEFRSRCG